MKICLIALATYLLASSPAAPGKEEKCFYFCTSRPVKADSTLSFLYTEVRDTTCSVLESGVIAAKWGEFADTRCKPTSGCTSDVSIYTTKEDAQKNLDKVINRYGSLYKLAKVNF